jgi:CBS domain-containing protein
MIAKDFVSDDCRVIDENENISRALSLFEETDSIIVTRKKEYAGMLVEKELTRVKLPPNAKVRNFIKHAPKLSPDTPIGEVARLMLENEIFSLPVFEGKKLKGVVKVDDLLKNIVEKEFGYEKIGKFVSKNVKFVLPGDNIGKVIKIFRENNISRLPVVDNGKVVGIVTMHDLMEKVILPEEKPEYGEFIAEKKRYLKIPVKGVMMPDPFTVSPDESVRNVVEEMIERKIGGVIVESNGKLEGIVTKKDLLEPIASAEKEEKIFIQFCGELNRVEDFDRSEGITMLKNFLKKHEGFLETGYLYVYLKQHKEKKHGIPLEYCKLRLSCPKGVFIAADNGWGFHAALKNAISAMEKQIEKARGK